MRARDIIVLSATTFAISTTSVLGGPCSQAIVRAQIHVDAKIASTATMGRFAPESIDARLHHQPTPASVAAAERQLKEGSGTAALAALERAREADREGNGPGCSRALAEARQVINRQPR